MARTLTNPRLDRLTDYPFTRLAELLDPVPPPQGTPPIPLHVGDPQLGAPDFVARILAEQAAAWGRYPLHAASAGFRRAAVDWLCRRFDLPAGCVDPERHVLPVAGSKEGLFHMGLLCVPGGGRTGGAAPAVLMPNPVYQVYYGAAVLAGGEPVCVPATAAGGFMPDFCALDRDLLDRTALAFLCNPSNPQGAVADPAYLQSAIRLAREYGFVLVVDECYSEIYRMREAPPPGALQACLALPANGSNPFANVLVLHSLSKRSSAPGLRCGFVAGDPDLLARYRIIRNYGGASVPDPVLAAGAALLEDEAHVVAARQHYDGLFDLADRALGNTPGFRSAPGGFFLWLDVGDGEAAAQRFWRDAGVRVMPGGYMAQTDPETGLNPGDPYVRVALVHRPAVAAEALDRMARVLGG